MGLFCINFLVIREDYSSVSFYIEFCGGNLLRKNLTTGSKHVKYQKVLLIENLQGAQWTTKLLNCSTKHFIWILDRISEILKISKKSINLSKSSGNVGILSSENIEHFLINLKDYRKVVTRGILVKLDS